MKEFFEEINIEILELDTTSIVCGSLTCTRQLYCEAETCGDD